jgi:hypothetical protein
LPTILRINGYRFFFFSNEGQEAPHIHVEGYDGYAKFWLEPVRLAQSKGYNATVQNNLRKLVVEHESLFVKRWNEYFAG